MNKFELNFDHFPSKKADLKLSSADAYNGDETLQL